MTYLCAAFGESSGLDSDDSTASFLSLCGVTGLVGSGSVFSILPRVAARVFVPSSVEPPPFSSPSPFPPNKTYP